MRSVKKIRRLRSLSAHQVEDSRKISAKLKPLDGDRIVYRLDTFAPKRYLRQESDGTGAVAYGDELDLENDDQEGTFDRAWLRAFLKPAQNWAESNEKPIAVGGYGMPRWQPELTGYLDDLVELFAKYEWSTLGLDVASRDRSD